MQKLILVKHAAPQVIAAVPPEKWQLSDKGRESCVALARELGPEQPDLIVSSTEPKAIETAQLVAAELKLPHEIVADLHEHDRSNVPHLPIAQFISMVELFFRKPDELVLGRETAHQAEQRFAGALEQIVQDHPQHRSIAVVSHGTVIALFLARHSAQPGFQLWRQMGLPSLAVLELPGYTVSRIIPSIGR